MDEGWLGSSDTPLDPWLRLRDRDGTLLEIKAAKAKEIADLLRKHGGKTGEELSGTDASLGAATGRHLQFTFRYKVKG